MLNDKVLQLKIRGNKAVQTLHVYVTDSSVVETKISTFAKGIGWKVT